MHLGSHLGQHLGQPWVWLGPPPVVVPALPKEVRLAAGGTSVVCIAAPDTLVSPTQIYVTILEVIHG